MSGLPRQQRPFKIYDERLKRNVPWRQYKTPKRAVEQTLALTVWLPVGASYTVYDERSAAALMQVTRRIEGLKLFEDKPGRLAKLLNGSKPKSKGNL